MAKRRSQKRKPLISALEPRILFDGAAIATAVDVLDNTSFTNDNTDTSIANDATQDTVEVPATQTFERDRKEVAFVDTTVADYETLVEGIDSNIEVFEISSTNEIETILKNLEDVDAVHILSHGNTGEITIGDEVISSDTLSQFEDVMNLLKTSLTQNGDLLLYGCNVASDGEGQEFIDEIASLTQADVAASDDITGSAQLNGDWDLEVESGEIETDEIVIENYDNKLASVSTFTVVDGPSSTPLTIADSSSLKIGIMGTYTSPLATFYTDEGFDVTSFSTSTALDQITLTDYDFFVIDLPIDEFTSAEVTAGTNFLNTGGRFLLIGEHSGFADQNTRISNFVANLGGALSITSASFAGLADDTVGNLNFTDSNINAGVDQMDYNAASYVNIDPDISEAVVVDESNNILVGDQAIGLGRITLMADVNPYASELNDGDNKIWFRNIAIDSATNRDIVTNGGNPNDGFGINAAASIAEDTDKADFVASDFSVSGSTANAIQITSAPTNGILLYSGSALIYTSGIATITSFDATLLTYTPDANYNGTDSFSWAGSTDGGTNYTASSATVSITIDPVNDKPTASNNTLTVYEEHPYTFSASNFGFSDIDGDTLSSVLIANTNISNGTLELTGGVNTGVITSTEVSVSKADIDAGYLVFTSNTDYHGTGDYFRFKVNDGTENSGSYYNMFLNVTNTNDAPSIINTDTTPTFIEDSNKTTITSTPVNIVNTSDFVLSDYENDGISTIKIQVENISDSGEEYLNIDGSKIDITTASSSTTATNGYSYSVTISGTTATLTLTTAPSVLLANATGFIKSVTYQNDADVPTTNLDRVVSLSLVDDGGVANSGNNTSAFEKVSDITISASDDNPEAYNMTAQIGPNSQRTFAEFVPQFDDVDGVNMVGHPNYDSNGDQPYQMEILSLPTTGTFEVYDYANGSGVDDKTDPSNWITISDISAMTTTSTYTLVDGRFVISMADLDNYRYNAGNNSNTTTSISWRVMTSGDTNDSTGWSNSASGLITIIDSASNAAPSVVSFVDTANTTISDGGTFTIPENGTANDLTKLTMVFSDDYTPEDYIDVVITSSDNSIIDPANIVENKSTTTTSGDTRTFNIVPVSDATGTVTLTFTMSDGDKTTTYDVDVVVNENPEIYNPGSVLTVPDINSYVEIANSAELQVQTYTYSIWVKPDTISSQWQPLIMKASDSGLVATRNFSMWIRPDSLQLHNTFFNTQTNSQVHIDTDSSHQLTQNEWNLITATYDGATLKTYINGDLAASIATTGTPINDSSSLFIGGLPNGYSTLGAFSGDIAEVSIYNDALTDVEIKDTMKTQLTGSEDNLVYYTRFTTDSNGDIVDLTATNNSGVLNGNADVSKQVDLDKNTSYSTFTSTDFSTNFLYTDAENDSFAGVKVVTIPSNGTLELSGVAVSAADVISSADIANLVYTPDVDFYGTDSFSYQAQDDVGGFSNTALFDLTVNYVDTDPKIMGTTTLSVDEDSGATTISGFTVTDYYGSNGLGDHTLTAKVVATNGVLAIATAGSTTVVGNGTNTVTITGTAAQIQSAVNTLSYTPDAEYSGTDPLDISIKDDTIGGDWKSYFASETGKFYNPNNGHYYEYVSVSSGISWTDAKIAAEKSTLYGLQGYLANVSTQAENDYVKSLLGGTGWFGANDLETEGSWVWAGGPEEGLAVPLNPDVSWDPWNSGEPNDHGSGEDAGQYRDDGTWNDLPTSYKLNGYVVEYGGFKNDTALEAAQLIVTVNGVNDAPIITATGVDGGANPEYIENDDPITLLDNVVITDADNTTLKNATVSISNNFTPGDILSFTNDGSTMGNIEGSYDATTGELTLVSPSYGDSFVFDGNDDYIDIGTIDNLSGSFSMEASVKVSDNTQNWARIFDLGQGSENDNIFFGFAGSTGKITIAIYDDQNGNFNGIETVNTLDENAWVHVAGVSNGDGTFSIYFDGVEQDVTIKSGSTTSLVSNSVSRDSSYIGKSNWSADADFAGEIKEARIWNDVRSEAEIKANMNQALDLNDSSNDNLLGYWTTSTNGNTVLDLSGNSNDGTLQGDTSISYNGTGTATIQEWENALKSIEFSSTSFNPGTQKDISWSVDDGQTVDNVSNVETTTIDIKELYSEQETNYLAIDSTIDLSSFSGNYAGEYIDFKISDETSTESLGFLTSSTPSTVNGDVTIVGNSVYLGNGSSANVIGQVDNTLNGQNGNNLRINFAVDFVNGDFNSTTTSSGLLSSTKGQTITIDGWNIYNGRVDFGSDTIAGLAIPEDNVWPSTTQGTDVGRDSNTITEDKGWQTYLNEDANGDTSIKMYSKMVTQDGYTIIRGPYIYSDTSVSLQAGDSVQFDWKAEGGDDAYDVFGYIVNVNDDTDYQIILNETGARASSSTSWATENVTVDSAGEYKFVFVSGSWDATGGTWLGAQLYIDDVKVTQQAPSSGLDYTVLESIAQKVTYTDSSDLTYENALGNRTIEITAPKVATSFDTDKPVASFSSDSGVVTITFDEALNAGDELSESDISVANGTLSNFTKVSNTQYTVEVTKDSGYTGDLTLVLAANSVTDTDSSPLQNVQQTFVIKDNIDLTSDANWVKLLYGNQYDYFDDVQANRTGTDLVGDDDHVLLSTQYNSSTDELAFRFRQESSSDAGGIFYLLGVDGTGNGALDFFVGVDIDNKGVATVDFYEAGNGGNYSPSTTSFSKYSTPTTYEVDVSAASDGDDIDGDGNVDGIISFKLDGTSFVNFANGAGGLTGYTINDQVNFMLLTATQTNSINGDIGGVDGNSSKISYADMGAFKPIVFSGDSSGENKATFTFDKMEVNDQISLDAVSSINYVDTDGVDNFTSQGGTITSSDVDANTTPVYSVDGGTVNGTTFTKVGDYGTLTLDSSTGVYTYEPNDSVIDALSESTSESFTLRVSDDNPNGLSTVDTKTLTINITAVNDSPLLGGNSNSVTFTENGSKVLIDSTITISDQEGESYDGGYLFIKNLTNGENSDQLVVTEIGGITLSGSDILYAGTVIGTIDSTYNGVDGKDLKINFNTDAYSVQVQALAQAIAFDNATDDISSDARTYQIQVNDGGEPTPRYSTKDITVNIDAINDLPVISLDSNVYEVEKVISTNPDGTMNLSGISLSDADHSTLTVTFETSNYGTLTFNESASGGITTGDITNNGTSSVTVTSTIAKINATLANAQGLTFIAGTTNDIITPGATSLQITAVDAESGQDVSTKQIIVLPAVPNAYSGNIIENEDTEVSVNLESLIDDVNGTNRGITIGTGTADVDLNLDGDTLDTNEVAGSITPLDVSKEILDNNGKLIGYQLTNGRLVVTEATLEDANPSFNFIYTPDTAGWSGTENFVYQYSSDGKTSLIAEINIVVLAVNDAPTITLSNGNAEAIDEDTTLVFEGSKAITLADLDDTGSETFDLTLSVSNGKLDLTQTTGLTFIQGNDGTGKIKVTGTLSDLQAAIDTLSYTPNAEYNGSDNLVITFNDKGNIGQGDVLEDTQTIAITINPINDAPTIQSYVDINITDGSGASIIDDTYVNYLKVSDVDTANLTYKIDNDGSEDVDVNGDVTNNSNLVDSKVGTYGTLEIDPTTGKYTFTPDKTAISALSDDAVESFVLDVFDGTTHKQVTININITADAQTASTYTEQDPATLVLQDTTIDTNESYGGGFIEFEVSSPEATEIISLEKVTTADTTDGVISIVGSTIFLGDGTTAAAIGQIDGTYNGEDGEKLRINFSVDFTNGDFNATTTSNGLLSSTKGQTVSIDGWNIYNGRVDFGSDTIAGLTIPEDTVWPSTTQGSDVGRDSNTITQDKGWMTYLNPDTSTDSSIKMYSKMVTQDGYTIVRGPYIYSDSSVSLQAGDSISFDWKAEGGDDAYDVFGYIVNVNDDTDYQVILNETGANASSETNWATVSQTVDSAGEYKFVFVSGSWDATGGTWLGAQLYIDDVKVTQANPSSGIDSSVLEKIAQKVTYENIGDLTATNDVQNKTITITTSSGDNTPVVHSDTKALDIQEVNDDPTMVQPATIYYTDTPTVDDFSDESGTLIANDVDTNTTFTYDITGSTDNGNGTVSLVGDNGILTLNKTTGAYTFTVNDNAINALGESIIETFTVTASDGDGGVVTKTVIVDITAVNDGPILGGAKPGDTSGDTYGAYTPVSYTENSSAVAIDPTITVTDPESKSYADGQLKISVIGNKSAGDMLSLVSTGGISVDGTDVLYGASVIGSIDSNYDGTNGTDLIINLTDKAFSNEVQALMGAVSYSSLNDYFINTTRTINMEINDGGNGGTATAALSSKDAIVEITPVNDLPVIDTGETKFEMEKVLGSTTVGTSEDGSLYLTGISFSDVDETSDVTVVLKTTDTTTQTDTMSISNGTISAGETFTWGDGSNSVTVTAAAGDSADSIAQKLVDEINNDSNLNGAYTASISGNYDGKFSVSALDIDNMFTSTVSDSSTNTDMTAQTTQEVYGLLTVKTGVTNGVTDITGNGTKSVTLVGTLAEINTTLAQSDGLKFVAGNGNDVVTPGVNFLSMSITDSQSGSESFNKEVVVLPAVPNSYSQNITLEEDGFATFDLGSLITDINDNSGYYTFGLVGEAGETEELQDGSINILNLGTISSTPTVITNGNGDEIGFNLDNGTLILENDGVLGSDFAKFTFTPNENWNGTEVIYYQYTSGDGKTGPVSKILLYTGAVNDAPEITSGDILNVDEDTSISFDSANGTRIVIDDLDVTSEELEVTLDVTNGKVTLNDTTGVSILEGTDSNAHIKIRGLLTDLQNALDNMSYQGNQDFYGNDSLKIEVNDKGNIGAAGNALVTTKTIDITVNPVNDAPIKFSDENLDTELNFGDEYSQDISYMFSDVEDSKWDMDFIATGLPYGITLDPRSGLISGRALSSGVYTVVVTAYDTGTPVLSAPSKTFEMLVIAPPAPEAPAEDTLVNKTQNDEADEGQNGFGNGQNQEGDNNGDDGNLEITRTELTSIVRDGGQDQPTVVSAGFTVDVSDSGQIRYNDESNQAFETVGLVVERMEIIQDQIEIEVIDTKAGQKYIATLADGNALPPSLSFDPNTGVIKGTLPAGVEELEISIRALSDDGTTRILNIKIDINELKEKAKTNAEAEFDTLKNQFKAESYKMTEYGSYVTSLFS